MRRCEPSLIGTYASRALFQPFTRADAARSRRQHDGAGLGLALAHRIAGEHCGRIEVSVTPGGGATFTLRLGADA